MNSALSFRTLLCVQLEASEAEIEGALEGLPIAPEQLEMAEGQYAVRTTTPSLGT